MIASLLSLASALACGVCAWVAGCTLLSLGRPRCVSDLLLMFGVLGLCVYGLGNALAPMQNATVPSAVELGWRVSLATTAAVFYSRVFGWRTLLQRLRVAPRGWRAWWRTQIAAGRNAGQRRSR